MPKHIFRAETDSFHNSIRSMNFPKPSVRCRCFHCPLSSDSNSILQELIEYKIEWNTVIPCGNASQRNLYRMSLNQMSLAITFIIDKMTLLGQITTLLQSDLRKQHSLRPYVTFFQSSAKIHKWISFKLKWIFFYHFDHF